MKQVLKAVAELMLNVTARRYCVNRIACDEVHCTTDARVKSCRVDIGIA